MKTTLSREHKAFFYIFSFYKLQTGVYIQSNSSAHFILSESISMIKILNTIHFGIVQVLTKSQISKSQRRCSLD
uniref:Uncharacterized protein n=1 Tax=Anguilla anguilla TaxID=7936 RepID=A0A0E9WI73_ANGAN